MIGVTFVTKVKVELQDRGFTLCGEQQSEVGEGETLCQIEGK